MNESLNNGVGMFLNSFLAGLVATVIPALIAGINTQTGGFNLTWAIVTSTLVVNALTSLILGINEYLRTEKGGRLGSAGTVVKRKGFLPFY